MPSTSRRPSALTPPRRSRRPRRCGRPGGPARRWRRPTDTARSPSIGRSRKKSTFHTLVDLLAQPAHLALGDAAHAHMALTEVIDRSGRDALDVGLLDHCGERLLGHPAAARGNRGSSCPCVAWECAAPAVPASRLPVAVAIAVAAAPVGPVLFSPWPGAGQRRRALNSISRSAAKAIMSRSTSASRAFSTKANARFIIIIGHRWLPWWQVELATRP